MKRFIVSFLALFAFSLFFTTPLASQSCPFWALMTPKDNQLFLYMPTTADPIFPEWGPSTGLSINTSPLAAFDVADLDSSIGTTAQLRQRIFEMVIDDYCEFNVEVNMMTLGMSPAASNWQIVGIGTDSQTFTYGGSNYILFGIAQDVDLNDSNPQDYARVYSDSFSLACSTAFSGSNSTLERWANAIAGTASHEAGHNYGLAHDDSKPVPGSGEDALTNHIMATSKLGLTCEQRASVDRHFSDTSYEILGHNLGLNSNTIHNWDFTNPNNTNACSLRFKILSTATTLTTTWVYTGPLSPWINPTVTPAGTTEVFHGTTYNVYYVDFTIGKTWDNGPSGQVPPGQKFHVGVSFNQNTGIIVKETILLDCSTTPAALPLQPRIFGYDTGFLDVASGDFRLGVFNTDPDRPLIVRNLTVQQVPRMIDIETMMVGMEPMGRMGMPINIINSFMMDEIDVPDVVEINLANLMDPRNVDITYITGGDCEKGFKPPMDGTFDVNEGEIEYCPEGTSLSLFPSTYLYITAEVIDPDACYWDPREEAFVNGPLESRVFYQFSGFVPDLNENGQDDLLDIRLGISRDENENGIPDEAEEILMMLQQSQINPRRIEE